MIYDLLLLLLAVASIAPNHTTVGDRIFSAYSSAARPPMTRKPPSQVKGGNGNQILRLDILEAVERLQEQKPKRVSEQ